MDNVREVFFVGSSRKDLKAFPEAVQDEMGYILYLVQCGDHHRAVKPFKGLNGVYEIKSDYDKDTYRLVYALKIGENIYVLHAFMKKSKRGIKTPKEALEIIKHRYKIAVEHEKNG